MKVFLIVLLIAALLLIGPFITIWALNTLFPLLAIPYTLETWLAVIAVGGLFKTSVSVNK